MKKRSENSRNPKQRRTSRATFPLISEEMKEWSAILQSELNSWPSIRTKSMFGFLFFYRRGNVFAALPRTRGFDSPSSLVFKFNPLPRALQKRAQGDSRMHSSTKASSKGWFSFELSSENDLRDALFWLNHAYEAAAK
ncbi:MAG: hypothetical protein WBQ89_05495 [Candidatus Acidiferrum sp.]